MIGVQTKAGPTWFKKPKTDAAGNVEGWWFREDREHFDYWIGHTIPHLVVLYDLDSRVGYWAYVTGDETKPTKKNFKILVPKANVVDRTCLDALIQVAGAGRAGAPWEGSIWTAGAADPEGSTICVTP